MSGLTQSASVQKNRDIDIIANRIWKHATIVQNSEGPNDCGQHLLVLYPRTFAFLWTSPSALHILVD